VPNAVIVNCAAKANIDEVERFPLIAEDVNVMAPIVMSRACQATGLRFVQISTDQVFGNYPSAGWYRHHESDMTNDPRWLPANVYGRQKLEAEQHVLLNNRGLVVRTQWVYGPGRPTWVDEVVRQAKSNEPIRAISDYVGIPTFATDLARAIIKLLQDPTAVGVYHLVNEGDPISRANLAIWILEQLQLNGTVEPCQLSDMEPFWAARRPANSVIKNFRCDPLPTWTESLTTHLQNGHN